MLGICIFSFLGRGSGTLIFSITVEMVNKVRGRKYIGMLFECCNVYQRIYINRKKTAYSGNCSKCCKKVEIKIVPHGTSARFFKAI